MRRALQGYAIEDYPRRDIKELSLQAFAVCAVDQAMKVEVAARSCDWFGQQPRLQHCAIIEQSWNHERHRLSRDRSSFGICIVFGVFRDH